MSPEEIEYYRKLKEGAPKEDPIIEISGPTDPEGFMASAPNYKDNMPFIQQPKKEPGVLEQAGSSIAESALGKATSAGMDKLGTWWGGLGKSAATAGPKAFVSKATPGVMTKLGAGVAAATPWILPAIIGAKMFGLFNKGGAVHANMGGLLNMDMGKFKGPLASMLLPQYKERGDEIEVPKSKPRYLMYPYQSNIELPMSKPRPMTYGEAYNKAYGKYGFEHSEPESEWGKSLYHGFNKALSPSILLDAKIMQWMHNKEMRDAGVPGFNQGGNVQHKEHGGMMTGPLSNNKSVKMEKKETVEYKN